MTRSAALLGLLALLVAAPAAQAHPNLPADHGTPVVPPKIHREAQINARVRMILLAFRGKPDDAKTWADARAAVDSYFVGLWRAGTLQGAKPELAFFVACGVGATMTQSDVDTQRLVVVYGVALVRPAEFSYSVVVTPL